MKTSLFEKDMFIKDTEQWAEELFGDADLGDNWRITWPNWSTKPELVQNMVVKMWSRDSGGRGGYDANTYATINIW